MFSDSICIIHWFSLWGMNDLTSRLLCSDEHILITSSPVALKSWWASFIEVSPCPCPKWLLALSAGGGGVSNNTSTSSGADLLAGMNAWTNGKWSPSPSLLRKYLHSATKLLQWPRRNSAHCPPGTAFLLGPGLGFHLEMWHGLEGGREQMWS